MTPMTMQPAFQQNPPLCLYIHIPWCIKKCPYCDFNSHVVSTKTVDSKTLTDENEKYYVQALLSDLEQDLPLVWGRSIEHVFIGGGTPSLFSAAAFDQLLSGIRARIPLKPFAEITLEANPGTAEAARFQGYFDAGINRLSIGVQSFHNDQLKQLGRIHDSTQAINAFQMARTAGFKQINIDLMYGLPGQNVGQALSDLKQAISLHPEHLSWYQLTIEPNTHFYSSPPTLPSEELSYQISEAGLCLLQQEGFTRYEVSAFARDNHISQHNLNYWQFGDYLGIGAGAHSKITHVPDNSILRRQKTRQPVTYLEPEKPFLAKQQSIDVNELPLEFMLNALRLPKGVESKLFQAHTGLNPQLIDPLVKKAMQKQLMQNWPERIQTTETGLAFLNDTLALFFSDVIKPQPEQQIIPVTHIN